MGFNSVFKGLSTEPHRRVLIRRLRKIAKSDYQLRHVCPSISLSAWNNSAATGRIFVYFQFLNIFRKSVEKIRVSLKSDKNNRCFTWTPIYIFDHVSPGSSENENFSDKNYRENQNTPFIFSHFFFFRKLCRIWDTVRKYCRAWQATDDSMANGMLDT